IAHVEVDLTKYEIASGQATMYEVSSSDGEGGWSTKQNFRVFAIFKPIKLSPADVQLSEEERVDAAVALVNALPAPSAQDVPQPIVDMLQVLALADPHHGKSAVGRETGHRSYDRATSRRIVTEGSLDAMRRARGQIE